MIDIEGMIPKSMRNTSKITVMGIGGGGSNAVDHMYKQNIEDVEYIVCNTDKQALDDKQVPFKILIGNGMGAGANPTVAKEFAERDIDKIEAALIDKDTRMLFLTAGMGGGTGTGAAPVIARVARKLEILTVGIVTMPHKAEGAERVNRAIEGLMELKKNLDAILIIDNTLVLNIFSDLMYEEAFGKADDILAIGVESLAEIIIKSYRINTDHNDIRKTMLNAGYFLMGTATGDSNSDDIVDELISRALKSPLLMQNDIVGAKNVLVSISNGINGFNAGKTSDILDRIQISAGGSAELIFSIGTDPTLEPDEVKLIVVAAGFDAEKKFLSRYIDKNGGGNNKAFNSDNQIDDEASELDKFEKIPAYKRTGREVYHHIDPAKLKIVKLNID